MPGVAWDVGVVHQILQGGAHGGVLGYLKSRSASATLYRLEQPLGIILLGSLQNLDSPKP